MQSEARTKDLPKHPPLHTLSLRLRDAIHASRTGAGPMHVIGLHGWAGNHRTFAPLTSLVPDHCTLHALDLPGHGQSQPLTKNTPSAMCETVVQWIDEHSHQPATLIGYCGGALYALELALRHPQRVRRLLLVDPFAYLPLYFALFTWGRPGQIAYQSAFGNGWGRRIVNAALRGKSAGRGDMTRGFDMIDARESIEHLRCLAAMAPATRFAAVHTPVTILHGDRTFKAVKRSAVMLRSILPNAQIIEIAGCGHMPLRDATATVAHHAFGDGES